MQNIIKNAPSLRDIYMDYDFTDYVTPKFKEDTARLEGFLNGKWNDLFELDSLITGLNLEANTIGFEQGFAYAVKLLIGGGEHA